nr:MAG: RNA-dependent RNA polymerase [Ips partiti-like virus 1]
MATKYLRTLESGPGFPFNYQPSRIDRNALFALNQTFDKSKIGQVREKYHRSRLNITDLRSDLLEYECEKKPRAHSVIYNAIVESVDQDIFGDCMITPLTHGAVANHENIPGEKSCGLPYKLQGFKNKREALSDERVMKEIRSQWYAIERNEDVCLPDVACYARAQICARDKNKVRATWGYPLSLYLTEGQYFYPLLEHLKHKSQPTIAYGIEIGTGGMSYINEMVRSLKGNIVVGDWSRFDKTIPAWLIRDAFKLVARHIDWTHVQDSEGKMWDVRPSKSKTRFRRMVDYFINTPIQLSSGERFMKHGGVPSGSCFTNIIDGIVNAIVTRYIVYDLTGELPLGDVYLGDDIVAVTEKPLNLELFAEIARYQFSMNFNPDKSYQTSNITNVHFLGYYNLHGCPYKPVDTVIASAIYPERPTKDAFETAIRLVGQAYSCFEPTDAKRFFQAAHILRKELDVTCEMMEDFIQDHPSFFKYLQTLGISARARLKIPEFLAYDLVLLTLPHACKRHWKRRFHNLEKLMQQALEVEDIPWLEYEDE